MMIFANWLQVTYLHVCQNISPFVVGFFCPYINPAQVVRIFFSILSSRTMLRVAPFTFFMEIQKTTVMPYHYNHYYLFAITIQVLNQITGEFEDVPCVPDGIFMNIGDILQIWSGDKLLANVWHNLKSFY